MVVQEPLMILFDFLRVDIYAQNVVHIVDYENHVWILIMQRSRKGAIQKHNGFTVAQRLVYYTADSVVEKAALKDHIARTHEFFVVMKIWADLP